MIALTAELVENFSGVFLSPMYDNPVKTPPFHRECWTLYCSDTPLASAVAPRFHAKAQPLSSRVLTPQGWSAVGDLEVGDRIVGRDGLPKRVTALHPISRMDVYEVRTRDGRRTRCNDAHLWTVIVPSCTQERERTIPLSEILDDFQKERPDSECRKGRTEYKYFLPLTEPVQFVSQADYAIDPYTLGAWLGDGHSEGGRITSADPEIFEYMPYEVTRTWSGNYLYRVVGLTEKLSAMGLKFNKHVPIDYLFGDIETRTRLLQGLMDTDGTCHQDGQIAYFCNTNWDLICAVTHLVRSLGGVAVLNENMTWCNGNAFDSWRVSVKLPPTINPFRLKRKASQWVSHPAPRQAIVGIEHLGTDMCRCISVEDDHYITDDFIVTHNSTALTHTFILANVLFRVEPHVMLVGSTEELAMNQLGDIAKELRDNESLRSEFGVQSFITDSKAEAIVRCDDGYEFRILARGVEQRVRGIKWKGRRPGLIVVDDGEEDEQVESAQRRRKLARWVNRALIPMGRRGSRVRAHGTIIHQDSFLAGTVHDSVWKNLFYKAHESFDDFSNILWPEQFTEKELRAIRQRFINKQDAGGYSQEYLNDPQDNDDAYLKKEYFRPMEEMDHDSPKLTCVGIDFAISKKDSSNRTSMTVGGKDTSNILHFVDQRVGRWDSEEIIDELFSIQERWNPDTFFVEGGQIWLALKPIIETEMRKQDVFLNFDVRTPIKDKASRGRAFQKRMKAGACRFDKDASWYVPYEEECLRFTGVSEARLDDQFDSSSLLALGFESMPDVEDDDVLTEDEWMARFRDNASQATGRSRVTGY